MKKRFIKFWLPVYAYAGLIFILSSIPGKVLPEQIPLSDKLLHAIEYAVLGYLVARAFKNSGRRWVSLNFRVLAILAAALYGLSDEFHQLFVPNRMASIWDVAFDGLGAVGGQFLLGVRFFKDI